jgi:hypothetical protein
MLLVHLVAQQQHLLGHSRLVWFLPDSSRQWAVTLKVFSPPSMWNMHASRQQSGLHSAASCRSCALAMCRVGTPGCGTWLERILTCCACGLCAFAPLSLQRGSLTSCRAALEWWTCTWSGPRQAPAGAEEGAAAAAVVLHCMLGCPVQAVHTPQPLHSTSPRCTKPQLASGVHTTYCHPGAGQLASSESRIRLVFTCFCIVLC